MKRVPVDRVKLTIPAERRLGATLRAAVLTEARSCGFSLAQATPLARAVTQKFRETAENPRRKPSVLVVVFEQEGDGLRVLIQPGPGRRAAIFRARRKSLPSPRTVRRHPSV